MDTFDLDRALISEDRVSINDLALGRATLVHPDDVAVVRRTDDDVVIGYLVRTHAVPEVSVHAFVAEQPAKKFCLLFVGRDRVCGRTPGDPLHQSREDSR